jgi:hypothetical protein
VLGRILELKRDEIIGDWRKLHNHELHNFYSSLNIVRMIKLRMRWAGHVAYMGEKGNAYRFLVGKQEEKSPLGRPRHRGKGIKIGLRKIGWRVWTGYIWVRTETSDRLL